MVGGYNGSFAILDCTIEAFPLAVHYWERHDGRLIQSKKVRNILILVSKKHASLICLFRIKLQLEQKSDSNTEIPRYPFLGK